MGKGVFCIVKVPALVAEPHGGVMDMTAGVGACKSGDCKFNKDYECVASSITVEMQKEHPDCMTYEAS